MMGLTPGHHREAVKSRRDFLLLAAQGVASGRQRVVKRAVKAEWPGRLRLLHEGTSVPEGDERARAAACPPAGGQAAPSSGLAFSQTGKMKTNIQEMFSVLESGFS